MKVTLEKDYRRLYTLEDLDEAKQVIKHLKDYDETARSAAESAAQHILWQRGGDFLDRIVEATAETAKNRRVWNWYGDNTGEFDVWIQFIARTGKGFLEGGAYLTDIWSLDGETDFTPHMWINHYTM